ncbi:MAG: hypothetical protein ACEPOW_01305 [Bacteroidales bacterium]
MKRIIFIMTVATVLVFASSCKKENSPETSTSLKSTSDWMSSVFSNKSETPINAIAIPGTHDSATDLIKEDNAYSIKPVSEWSDEAKKAVGKKGIWEFSRNQSNSVKKQLEDGVRYFDFRIQKYNGKFYTHHHLVSNPLLPIIQDIDAFTQAHPKEILYLDFQAVLFENQADYNEFLDLLVEKFGDKIVDPNKFKPTSPIGSLWSGKQNIIMFASYKNNYSQQSKYLFNRDTEMLNYWPDKYDKNVIVNLLSAELAKRPMTKFFVSQTIQSPHNENLIASTKGGPVGIIGMVKDANSLNNGFKTWYPQLLNVAKTNNKSLNIMIYDQYQLNPEIVQDIINSNK